MLSKKKHGKKYNAVSKSGRERGLRKMDEDYDLLWDEWEEEETKGNDEEFPGDDTYFEEDFEDVENFEREYDETEVDSDEEDYDFQEDEEDYDFQEDEEDYDFQEDGDDDFKENENYDSCEDEDYDAFEDEYYEYYEDDFVDNSQSDQYDNGHNGRRKKYKQSYADTKGIDWALAFSAIIILILAIVTGSLYYDFHVRAQQVAAFEMVGSQLEDIDIVGESGLLAIGNAKQEALASVIEETYAEEPVEEIPEIEETEEEEDVVQVILKVTSIQSDLKIKFVNHSTGKLIGGAPFVAKIVGDNGKEYEWNDKDQDGIIYHTEVPNGTYTITVNELTGDLAARYTLPKEATTQKVTDQIAYKKVDVKEEIKSEAQVNVAVEDTAKQDMEVESTLQDTVEWIESTEESTGTEEEYEEVSDEDIKLPTQAKARGISRVLAISPKAQPLRPGIWRVEEQNNPASDSSQNPEQTSQSEQDSQGEQNTQAEQAPEWELSFSGSDAIMKIGEYITYTASGEDKVSGKSGEITWNSSDTSVASVDNNGTVTALAEGTATITATLKEATEKNKSVTITVKKTEETEKPVTISLKETSLTLVEREEKTIEAEVSNTDNKAVEWTSSDEGVVTVSEGKIHAVKEGTATVTAMAKEDTSKTATCQVTVMASTEIAISLDVTSLTMKKDEERSIKETVTGTDDTSVEWTSSDTEIVTVDNGRICAWKNGKATVTVISQADPSKKATCEVTVGDSKQDSEQDYTHDSTKLTDKEGNQLYRKTEGEEYVEATYADYFGDYRNNGGKFYRRKSRDIGYNYTGWQTIDGATYYFDKDGNKVTGDQVIQGAKYHFDSDGKLSAGSGTMGIDVSKWNGDIDWTAVRNSGVSYVIIRCGYRGSTGGSLIEDSKYYSNIKGAKAAGLQVGVYFFTQAVNEVEAVEEASMVLNLIGGQGLNLPVYLDVEPSGGRADGIGKEMRTKVCKAFCETIRNSGYKAGIYANKTWLASYINTASLTNYEIWLAQYAATPTYTATRYDMWQYSSKGSVSGIKGNVDLNLRYN